MKSILLSVQQLISHHSAGVLVDSDEGPRTQGRPAGTAMTLREIVQSVVADARPGELHLIAALDKLSDAQVSRRLARGRRRQDPLGFGLGEAVVLITPIVWTAVQEVVNRITDSATESLLHRMHDAFRRLLRKRERSVPLPRFDEHQLAEVHRRILEKASAAGVSRKHATMLADSVVGRLALAAPEQQQTHDG